MILGTFFAFMVLLATINSQLWSFVLFLFLAYGIHKFTEGEVE